MKRTITLSIILLLSSLIARADVRGGWTATTEARKPGKIHINLHRDHSNNGQTMDIADFTGLTEAQIHGALYSPMTFALKREAGTVTFDGAFKGGSGGGQFAFAPNRAYAVALKSLGVSLDQMDRDGDHNEDVQLFHLAVLDVSTAYIRSMQAAGYRESLDKYMSMRIFRVTPELITEYRNLGMTLSADQLVTAQIHKVSPAYVREMRTAGYTKLDFDDLVSSRIHKATPEFIARMRELGYGNADFDDYISFRIHKVTPEFIQELATLGYKNIDSGDLVAMRIHRVTPEFIRQLAAEGYRNVPVSKLVSMRIHGIDAKFVKRMNDQ